MNFQHSTLFLFLKLSTDELHIEISQRPKSSILETTFFFLFLSSLFILVAGVATHAGAQVRKFPFSHFCSSLHPLHQPSHFTFFASSISILSSYGDCHGLALGHRLGHLTLTRFANSSQEWEALPQCDDTFCPHTSVVYFSDYKNSKSLLSMSTSPLLPCKWFHQYHLSRLYIYIYMCVCVCVYIYINI